MNFRQRFTRFLIGVGIGVLLSAYFFKDKSHLWTSWLPGNQVKERIINSYMETPPEVDCVIKCLDKDIVAFKENIRESEVNFKQSQTKGEIKEYILTFPENDTLNSTRVMLKDSTATILEIRSSIECACQ